MTIKTLDDINGYEYDWLGCDKYGQVALFSTAGVSYAPSVFLENTDAYDQAIESILVLPATTSAKAFPVFSEEIQNTWKLVSERGIYGYDADFTNGGYKLISIPENAITIDELPLEVAAVVKQFKFATATFDSRDSLKKSEIIESGAKL